MDNNTIPQPLTFATPPSWAARESKRMEAALYAPVPWAKEPWAQRWANQHFPHLAKKHEGLIAYTPDNDKGTRDIQTPIKPGRYLQRFYGDILSAEAINTWANLCLVPTCELSFATTFPEIQHVYQTDGLAACMSKRADSYRTSGIHPLQAYIGSDLAIAYIHQKGTTPLGRAIVWPARKIHSRIYGLSARMLPLLERAGYRSGTLDGATLPVKGRWPTGNTPPADRILCPFVDHMMWATLKDNTLTLSSRAVGATHSVQHGDGNAYPIRTAPLRPYGISNVQSDWLQSVTTETGAPPEYWPDGHPYTPSTPKRTLTESYNFTYVPQPPPAPRTVAQAIEERAELTRVLNRAFPEPISLETITRITLS